MGRSPTCLRFALAFALGLWIAVEGEKEREMAYEKGGFGASGYAAAVQEHLFHDDFGSVVHAQRDHCETVADQDHVDACLVGDVCRGKVVGGDDGNGLFFAVHGHEGR